MQRKPFQNSYQFLLISKPCSSFYMYTHIIPGACLVGVIIPGSADICMRAREYSQYVRVLFKCFMMVRISHDMTGKKKLTFSFIDKYRHLRGNRFIVPITARQKSKRVITDKL